MHESWGSIPFYLEHYPIYQYSILSTFFATGNFRASTSPTSINKFPPRVKNTAVKKTQVWRDLTFRELPDDTGIASIGAHIQKLWLTEKYIKYQDTHADEM